MTGARAQRQDSEATSHDRLVDEFAEALRRLDPDGRTVGHIGDVRRAAADAAGMLLDTAELWDEVLGGFYDVDTVRRLLGRDGRPISKQAVSKRRGLLALRTRSGRVVYPAFQFRDGGPFEHLAGVLDALPEQLVSRWTLAAWLVSAEPDLDGQPPVALLAAGQPDPVVRAARRWAAALAA